MPPAVAERDAVDDQPVGQIGPSASSRSSRIAAAGSLPPSAARPARRKAARPRQVRGPEKIRPRRRLSAETAQQGRSPVEPDDRIVLADLEPAGQCLGSKRSKRAAVYPQWEPSSSEKAPASNSRWLATARPSDRAKVLPVARSQYRQSGPPPRRAGPI